MDIRMIESKKLERSQRVSAKLLSLMPPLHTLPPKIFRPMFLMMDRMLGLGKTQMHEINEYLVPATYVKPDDNEESKKIRIRAYYPTEIPTPSKQDNTHEQRSLVFFHGGGCVIGSIETHDRFCRYLAKHSNMIIISVDYRLAPEHKFPAPVCDAIDAWNWINHHHKQLKLHPRHIGVGGDSAGGYLACIIGQSSLQHTLTVQSNYLPSFQFLLYPMLSLVGNTHSYEKFNKHLILTNKLMDYFINHFLNSLSERHLPLASPVLNEIIKTDIKTYILTLGFDPLRDDGIAYAKRLKQAEAEIVHEHFPDCMHAFISVTSISKRAKEATHAVAMALEKFNH